MSLSEFQIVVWLFMVCLSPKIKIQRGEIVSSLHFFLGCSDGK